jgi:GT2 family glycosyltransferase
MKIKTVDICITTYNRNDRLIETLDILSKQTNTDFNLIVNDDGNKTIINPNDHPIITKYIWNKDDGYHRVARFNESVSLCGSPFIILLDDDCIPVDSNFVQSHVDVLNTSDVCKGKIRFPNGDLASGWFSTANLGIRKKVIDEIGLFDNNFDGHYGHEDQDLGNRLNKENYVSFDGSNGTMVNHGTEMYANGDRSDSIVGHNTRYFISKWGYDPR